jgi:signal transduction histidine kinase
MTQRMNLARTRGGTVSRSVNRVSTLADDRSVSVRLDDAARISGRLAHDFDNLLMGIMGYCELAQAQIEPRSRAAQFLRELLGVAQNAHAITGQLHLFSRGSQKNQSPTRLQDLCGPHGMDRFTEQPNGVIVEATLASELPPVAVGSEPLQAILGQLLRNAAEAMPNGGRVSVTANAVTLADGLSDTLPAPLAAGDYVAMTVTDTGAGVPKLIADRVGQEPFVTTKPGHRGLGIPIVLRTLGTHNGALRITNSNQGTAIVVYMPSVENLKPSSAQMSAVAEQLEASSK